MTVKSDRIYRETIARLEAEGIAKLERQEILVEITKGLTTEELRMLNPNLLRAAPAMYEALKAIASETNVPKSGYARAVVDIANQALAKVEGG